VNSKHFFAKAISCGRLERAGAVMNRENLKNNSDYDSLESYHKRVLRMQKSEANIDSLEDYMRPIELPRL
jgi:hypothetical protein